MKLHSPDRSALATTRPARSPLAAIPVSSTPTPIPRPTPARRPRSRPLRAGSRPPEYEAPGGERSRTGRGERQVVHTPGGPDVEWMVGVGHGPDAGVEDRLLGPVFRGPGESRPPTIGRAASERPPAAATAAATPSPWTRTSAKEREVGEVDRASGEVGSGETSSTSERDKQEYTRDQGRPASAGRAHPDGLHVRRHYRAQLSRSGDRVDAGWASRKR